MPYYTKNTLQRIEKFFERISHRYYRSLSTLNCTAFVTKEPVPYERREDGERIELSVGERWGGLFDCGWFHFTGELPQVEPGQEENLVLLIDISGEGLYYDAERGPVQGLTAGSVVYEFGSQTKRVLPLSPEMVRNGKIDIWIDGGCNDLFGRYIDSGNLKEASVALCLPQLRGLYYDFYTLKLAMENMPQESAHCYAIRYALNAAINEIYDFTEEEAAKARAILAPELAKKGATPSLSISAIGHAHIDLAWLWPIRETIRKGARTFATVDRLMDRYPDYKFGVSQPQLLAWMKEYYPKLYERIKLRIKEGRIECQGAMWVEADTNLAGGEALVRQILYGQQFWREEFGERADNVWLPDVFGYTGALPQIMQKSGLPYFMTQKLSWNEHNPFPHQTFRWTGIDGSTVLAHMPPEETYNSAAAPDSIRKIEENYHDKGVCDQALMLFGVGDGGGGPGTHHLEKLERLKDFADFAPVEQRFARDFFQLIDHDTERYHEWVGELYFEYHRGTYTSQAKNKRFNRRMEQALRELEFACVLTGQPLPEEVDELWKETLLYQFHDILPGSSIGRVYDESVGRYEKMLARTNEMIGEVYGKAASGLTAYNSLGFARTELLCRDGSWYQAELPALGSSPLEPLGEISGLKADREMLENECLRVRFGEEGEILSIFDKANNREVLESGAVANRFPVYDDTDGDGWDIRIYYNEQVPKQFAFESAGWELDGPQAVRTQEFRFGGSVLRQRVILCSGSPLLTFETEVDWQESDKMLRTAFPVEVRTDAVTCDIQFGNLKRPTHRNTTWDMTRFEICAHKWIDLSRADYGVAMLSDCKYGFSALGNVMEIALLRSSGYPDPNADRGQHQFSYALYPHAGDEMAARVEQRALAFNIPPVVAEGTTKVNPSPLLSVEKHNIEVAAVKPAEDGDGFILRLFETDGVDTACGVTLPRNATAAKLCDLMEQELEALAVKDGRVIIPFHPYEIHTIRFV